MARRIEHAVAPKHKTARRALVKSIGVRQAKRLIRLRRESRAA